MSVTETHEEKETLAVDVNLPGHEARVTTELFVRTRREVLEELDNRCEVSGAPASEVGPIELHHFWVERCEAEKVDPFRLHHWISLVHQKASAALAWFDRQLTDGKGYAEMWSDPYSFTDDMHANGLALCKRLHTGKGEGIHAMPFPLWQFWATGRAGFQFVGQDAVRDEEPDVSTH